MRQLHADHRGYARCVSCGVLKPWRELQAGHFMPKSRGSSVYFECRNIHPQCVRCNIWAKESAMIAYTRWMLATYGEDEVERLERLARTQRKFTRAELLEILAHWRQCEREV